MYKILHVSALKCHYINIKYSLGQNINQELFTHAHVIKGKSQKKLKRQITHNIKCPHYCNIITT